MWEGWEEKKRRMDETPTRYEATKSKLNNKLFNIDQCIVVWECRRKKMEMGCF